MTREERINSALLPILEKMREHRATDEMCKMYDNGFHVGAMWADAHPHWISVEEQDIPLGQWVITYAPNEIYYSKIDVERLAMDGSAEDFGITHWMPLPQAPTVAENATVKEKGGEHDTEE